MTDTTETEVSSTPYLDPDNEIKMTEEPYPPVGFRIFSQEGVGERPGLTKKDLKGDPEDYAAQAPLDPETPTDEVSEGKRQTPAKKASTRKSAGSKAGTSKKGN
jgi:hypothetical protein